MTKTEVQELINAQWNIIHDRESKLRKTDYIAAKLAEGVADLDEYSKELDDRQNWRYDINDAEDEIKRLESLETEEELSIEEP